MLVAILFSNVMIVLEVSVLKDNPKWLCVVLTANSVAFNAVLCVMASRYYFIYHGNKFLMEGK